MIDRAGQGAAGLCRLSVRPDRRGGRDRAASRSKTCRRPTTTARRRFAVSARQAAGDDASARSAGHRAHGRARRPRGRAQAHAAGRRRAAPMIGVKPLFSGRSLGEGENATFDVVVAAPDGTTLARSGLRYELLKVEIALSMVPPRRQLGVTSRSRPRAASPTARSTSPPTSPAASRLPVQWGRYRLEVSTGDRNGPVTSIGFDAGWYAEASADTPDLLEIALDKPEYTPGDSMTVAVTARTAGKVTLNVDRRPAASPRSRRTCSRAPRSMRVPVGNDWGSGAYVVATLAPSARRAGAAHARPRHRRAVVRDRPQGAHARARHEPAAAAAAEQRAAHAGQGRRARRRARRRASSSPRSMSASSTSPTTSRRRPTTTISASAGSPPRSAISTAS